MFENLDKVKSVITEIFTQISLNKLSNCHVSVRILGHYEFGTLKNS